MAEAFPAVEQCESGRRPQPRCGGVSPPAARPARQLTRRQFAARSAVAALSTALPPLLGRARAVHAGDSTPAARTVGKAALDDAPAFQALRERVAQDYPGLRLGAQDVDGPQVLSADHGGMKVFWVYKGGGEVFLPRGYRTQESGSQPLPDEYQPDALDPAFADLLDQLLAGLSSVSAAAAGHVEAILRRRQGDVFLGDFPAELWSLEHVTRPWSDDSEIEAALVALFGYYRQVGYSTKQVDSFERIAPGDQLIACGAEQLRVRGRFRCLTLEKVDRTTSHISTARRLNYLVDTAGGCSFDFDPFRRLPLTWYLDHPGQQGDGRNFVNSHVVHIPQELSSTHFHLPHPVIGGLPQTELYLVLDPASRGLASHGRVPSILVFPELPDVSRYRQLPLAAGDVVYIPPGVGHRGLDVFVNVLTIPGFKPHNEFYIDQDIRDRTDGSVPYNQNGLARKNYARLEDLL